MTRTARAIAIAGLGLALGCAGAPGSAPPWLGGTEVDTPALVETPPSDLPAPDGLSATSGELREIPLRWDPILVGHVGGYVVERSLKDGGSFERIAVLADRLDTVLLDRGFDLARKAKARGADPGLGDGATYVYRVRAFDKKGHLSASASAPVAASTAALPAVPEGLRAYSHLPRRAALSWKPVADPTVAGYVVYRSPSQDGPFEPIAQVRSRHLTSYVDRGLGDLRVLYYRVAAVNAAGGEGAPSPSVRALTKPDPLPPAGLRLEASALGENRLTWDANVERDLASYRVLRRRSADGEAAVVIEVPASTTGAVDRDVAPGEAVSYSLVAIDADGLKSAECSPLRVVSTAYGLSAQPLGRTVELRWNASPVGRVRVLRLGRLGSDRIGESGDGRFVDAEVKPGDRYRYAVVLVRPDGSEAPQSEPVEVAVPGG